MRKEEYIRAKQHKLKGLLETLTWMESAIADPVSAYGKSGFTKEDIQVVSEEINWIEDELEAQGCGCN